MTRDTKGNDLSEVEVPLGGGIAIVDYNTENKISPEELVKPNPTLPEAYGSDSWVGLITEDGGFQDSRDADDPTKFFQEGYQLNAEPDLTTSFTVAENNKLIRKLTLGEPDSNGVYAVDDIIQNGRYPAYQEEPLKGGRVRRRAGVVQVTGNEPNQSTRGSVKGSAITVEWTPDEMYDNHRYYEYIYDPKAAAAGKAPAKATAK